MTGKSLCFEKFQTKLKEKKEKNAQADTLFKKKQTLGDKSKNKSDLYNLLIMVKLKSTDILFKFTLPSILWTLSFYMLG